MNNQKMNLTLRRFIGAAAILAGALIWWYPESQLIQSESVDWAGRYERQYTPQRQMPGAMQAARSFLLSGTEPVPLTRFIDQQLSNRTHQAENPAWADVFAALELSAVPGERTFHYARPGLEPFAELQGRDGFVEWQDVQGIRHLEYRILEALDYGDREIPAAVRFPWRQYQWELLFGVLVLAGWGFTGRPGEDLVASSTAALGYRLSWVCLVLFSGLLLWPFVHGTFGSDGSFASLLIGLVLFVGALTGVWLFRKQVVVVDNMIHKGECLAHFTFTDEEWARYMQWDHKSHSGPARGMFRVILAIAVVVGIGFMLLMRDAASVWVFGFLMAFMVVLRGFVWLSIELPRRRNLRRGEVYISPQGVYINGSVHTWHHFLSRIESVRYSEDPLPHIGLTYSQMQATQHTYFYRHHIEVRIPVPDKQKAEARHVVEKLKPESTEASK